MSKLTVPFCVSCTKDQGKCACENGLLIYPESYEPSSPNITGAKRRRDEREEAAPARGKAKVQVLGPNSQGVMAVMARGVPPVSMNRNNTPTFICPPGYRPSKLAGAESSGEICLSARLAMVYIDDARKTLQRHFGKKVAFLVCLGVLEGSPLPQTREKLLGLAASLIGKPQPPQPGRDGINHSLLPEVIAALRHLRSTAKPLNQEFGERLAKEICVNILETGRIPAHPRDVETWFFKGKLPQEMDTRGARQVINRPNARPEQTVARPGPTLTPRQAEHGIAAGAAKHHHSDLRFRQ